MPIGAIQRGGPADLVGAWRVAAAIEGGVGPAAGAPVDIAMAADGAMSWRLGDSQVAVRPAGAGRFAAADGTEFWLLWADEGFRTAVIGTPDGRFGWIMHRPGEAAPDRTAAAREILDFNGYDLEALRGG